jgi:hypothetical protein
VAEEKKEQLPLESFTVSVIETFEKLVDVEADTPQQAVEIVRQMYEHKTIVFDARDLISTEFAFWEKKDRPEEPTDWKAKFEELDKRHHILVELICENDLEEYIRQTGE